MRSGSGGDGGTTCNTSCIVAIAILATVGLITGFFIVLSCWKRRRNNLIAAGLGDGPKELSDIYARKINVGCMMPEENTKTNDETISEDDALLLTKAITFSQMR